MGNESSWEKPYRIEVFGEPWLRSILGSSASKPKAVIMIWATFGLLPLVLYIITTLIDGSFSLEGDAVGLREDITSFSFWVVLPAVVSGVVIVLGRFPDVLHTLQNVIARTDTKGSSADGGNRLAAEGFEDILKRYERRLMVKGGSRNLATVLVAIGLALWAQATGTHWFSTESFAYGFDTWGSQNYMTTFLVRTLYEFVLYAMVGPYVLFKFIMILHTMRSICIELHRMKVLRIRPLNPDKAGGLGGFGQYSLSLLLPVSAPVVLIAVYALFLGVNPLFIVTNSLYVALLITLFFYPLSGAHQAMRDRKQETLRVLSSQINARYDNFMGAMTYDTPPTLGPDFEVVDKLDKIYVRVQGMPVWPFDLATFSRFATIIGTVVLSVWLRWLVGLIG